MAARDGEYVQVGGSVEGGEADGSGGVSTRAYTIVVKAAVHCLRREGGERSGAYTYGMKLGAVYGR
eukprot:12201677-Prorocentrum_lima.AAC.1